MSKLLKKNRLILLIVFIGFLLRAFRPLELFAYSHDQDLIGWFIRDVIFNHHLRLIGQETSSHGIFIGPYFYYLLIPFYLLTRFDPAGGVLLSIILGTCGVISSYFVLRRVFNERVGIIGALIYSVSILIVFTEREVVPTMPVILWSIWFLFALHGVLKGKKYAYPLIGFLVGVIWSINLQLIILMPVVLVAQVLSKKKILNKYFVIGVVVAVLLNLPFFAFEARHGLMQTKALIASLTTNKDYVTGTSLGFAAKLDRTMQLVYRNTTNLFGMQVLPLPYQITFWTLVIGFVVMVKKKVIIEEWAILFILWVLLYIVFFSVNSINISEYYLNGMNIVFLSVFSVGVSKRMESMKRLGYAVVGLLVIFNLYLFVTRPIDRNGYVERKEIIAAIKADADAKGYPCVSLSFITSPGNDLGYRYFTWELGLKTKPISNEVPVYSIVFPLSKVDSVSKTYGVLGLIMPDYKRYNLEIVKKACEGEDYTLTQPMFGFTQ